MKENAPLGSELIRKIGHDGGAVSFNLTVRDYFVAHAPAEPWAWYGPAIPMPPEMPKSADNDAWEFTEDERHLAAGWLVNPVFELTGSPRLDSFREKREAYRDAFTAWNAERERQRCLQWPGFWADQMLAQRGKVGEQS